MLILDGGFNVGGCKSAILTARATTISSMSSSLGNHFGAISKLSWRYAIIVLIWPRVGLSPYYHNSCRLSTGAIHAIIGSANKNKVSPPSGTPATKNFHCFAIDQLVAVIGNNTVFHLIASAYHAPLLPGVDMKYLLINAFDSCRSWGISFRRCHVF